MRSRIGIGEGREFLEFQTTLHLDLARERFDDAAEPILKVVLARDQPCRPGHELVGRIERSPDACTAVTNREIPN